MTTTITITTTADRLMELAGHVPSSGWCAASGHVTIPRSEDFPGYDINLLPGHHRQASLKLARFIAACDPLTITALCSAIKEMAAERDALAKALTAATVVIEGQDRRMLDAAGKVAPLVAAAADVDGERAANAILTAENERLLAERSDLSLLVTRLIRRMRAARSGEGMAAGDDALEQQAIGYLQRKRLMSPLRATIDAAMNDRKEG